MAESSASNSDWGLHLGPSEWKSGVTSHDQWDSADEHTQTLSMTSFNADDMQ